MAFVFPKLNHVQKLLHNVCYTTLMRRPMGFKSALSLDNLYPKSTLKITTPAFTADPKDKFSGYIPLEKLDITYSASSGPGGQNVNKVHTKVDLRFKVGEAEWLHPDIRQRIEELHPSKISKDGYLILRSDLTRSQQMNLADCMQKLRALIRDAAVTKREPSPETQEIIRKRQMKAARLRVAIKREDSLKRALRQPPNIDL